MTRGQQVIYAAMRADTMLGNIHRFFCGERSGLITALFHNIFKNTTDLQSGLANPLEEMTIDCFTAFLTAWRKTGCRFVSLQEIADGLDPQGRYILITFDDGYRSVLDIFPVLESFQAPAVVFVTSENIRTGAGFWPNTVYREEMAIHGSSAIATAFIEHLKGKNTGEIQRIVSGKYGSDALRPYGDIDRPLTVKELAALSQHPLIEIGNHTANHADLTVCTQSECFQQIMICQNALEQMTGKKPVAVAYPYGRINESVIAAAAGAGLRWGFSCEEGKNRLPLGETVFRIKRFDIQGSIRQDDQCRRARSDVAFCGPLTKHIFSRIIKYRDMAHKQHKL
jgi:peptidoglycan/xylan/chitin deacetylase (PgdA/CDA1 family)